MKPKPLVIEITAGEVRHGLWCDEHLLPHRHEVDLIILSSHGVSKAGTSKSCDDDGA